MMISVPATTSLASRVWIPTLEAAPVLTAALVALAVSVTWVTFLVSSLAVAAAAEPPIRTRPAVAKM